MGIRWAAALMSCRFNELPLRWVATPPKLTFDKLTVDKLKFDKLTINWSTDIWPTDNWSTDIWPTDNWPTDIWPTEILPTSKLKFDQRTFNKLTFDQRTFNKLTFDQRTFNKLTFDQLTFWSTHSLIYITSTMLFVRKAIVQQVFLDCVCWRDVCRPIGGWPKEDATAKRSVYKSSVCQCS